MPVHEHRTRARALRVLAAAAILAAVTSVSLTQTSAAGILITNTKVASSGNPALAGSPVTFTATVRLGGSNLGPITPTGTVTFTYGTTVQSAPLGSCIVLLTQCRASSTFTALPEIQSPTTVTARYNGDLLSKPSTGTLSQETNDPIPCLATELCDGYLSAANGTSSFSVDTDSNSTGPFVLEMSYESARLSCTTPNSGDTAVFNVTDNGVAKVVRYYSYGSAATAIGDSPRACWFSDQPFTTASGAPATPVPGGYEGLLPQCWPGDDSSNPPPCVSEWDFGFGEGDGAAYAYVQIQAPPGDPKGTR